MKSIKIYSIGIFLISITILSLLLVVSINVNSINSPLNRFGHSAVYLNTTNTFILFGGAHSNGGNILSDTWEFNCNTYTWKKLETINNPPPMLNHGMAYDPINKRIITFGGLTGITWDRIDEMWSLSLANLSWAKLDVGNKPSARSDPSMYYDSEAKAIVLFGGYNYDDTHMNDLWTFDVLLNKWTKVSSSLNEPQPRYGHSMYYDELNNKGIMFGGRVYGLNNELWTYDLVNNSWVHRQPLGNPITRYCHSMIYTQNGAAFLFGGNNEATIDRALKDSWFYNYSTNSWTQITTLITPLPREYQSLVYSSINNEIILFGGAGKTLSESYGDTWLYNCKNSSWTQLIDKEPYKGTDKESYFILGGIIIAVLCVVVFFGYKSRRKRNLQEKTAIKEITK